MSKLRAIIFGNGVNFTKHREELVKKYDIITVVDNNYQVRGGESPTIIQNCVTYDVIIVTPGGTARLDILKQLNEMGVKCDAIRILQDRDVRHWKNIKYIANQNGFHACFDAVEFDIRNYTDVSIMNDIYFNLEYNLYICNYPAIVVDCGANTGLGALFFASYPNVSQVYAFEPFLPTYKIAEENIKGNNNDISDKIHLQQIGLGDKDEELLLEYDVNYPGCMSTLRNAPGDEKVHIQDVAAVMEKIVHTQKEEKLILKIDTEGAEYAILKRLHSTGLLKFTDYLLIETHFGREEELEPILREEGFSYFLTLNDYFGLGLIKAMK